MAKEELGLVQHEDPDYWRARAEAAEEDLDLMARRATTAAGEMARLRKRVHGVTESLDAVVATLIKDAVFGDGGPERQDAENFGDLVYKETHDASRAITRALRRYAARLAAEIDQGPSE